MNAQYHPETAVSSVEHPPPHLLVIDDDQKGSRFMVELLSGSNVILSLARNGQEGLERARADAPDLILLDVVMPGLDGLEVLVHLKEVAVTRDIPVLLISGRTEAEVKARGFELGASDFITKPVEGIELRARVALQLRRSHHERKIKQDLFMYRQHFGQLPAANSASASPPVAAPHLQQMHHARRLLLERMDSPPSLDELASEVGITQPRLSERFRAAFGTTVFGYLREVRLQRARTLLVESSLPIKAVALEIGYRNTADLSRAIKARFGMTPTELRDCFQP